MTWTQISYIDYNVSISKWTTAYNQIHCKVETKNNTNKNVKQDDTT